MNTVKSNKITHFTTCFTLNSKIHTLKNSSRMKKRNKTKKMNKSKNISTNSKTNMNRSNYKKNAKLDPFKKSNNQQKK